MFMKRLIIGLVTFGVSVAVFWFYSQYQRTPDISRGLSTEPNAALSEVMRDAGQGGTIGQVTVKRFEKIVIKDRDPDTGRVIRELGFMGDLWHEGSSIWEVVSPFITLYESDMTCFVTADKGVLRIEEINNTIKPSDMTFTGDVHVHIQPKPGSTMEEIFVDLDDIVFQKNTSQFSSSGRILVRSPSIRLSGHGVDFIYNAQKKCIQYLRMVALDYLRVRTAREGGLFSFQTDENAPAATPLIQDANDAAAWADEVDTPPQPLGPIYKCLLQDSVVIQTPKQKIHSLSHIALTDILWPKSGFGRSDANDLDPNSLSPSDPNRAAAVDASPADPNTVLPEEDVLDIIITCDQGILISPADSNWTPESEGLVEPEVVQGVDVNIPSFHEDATDKGIFVAQDIAYNVLTQDARAQGPVELTFYADPNRLETQGQLIPINVTAQKYGQFDAGDNSIVFTDHCECILQKQDANQVVDEYRLEAPTIRIEMVDDKDGQAIAAREDLKRIEASGGGVTLGLYTRASDTNRVPDTFMPATGELLAGAEMTCESFECDPNKGHEIFTAQGPGTVALNNAKAVLGARSGKKPEPYYALLNGFETMQYHVADNLIVADAQDPNVLQFIYSPVLAGPNMVGQANHVEIHFVKTKAGQTQMGTLRATGNVSVEHGPNQFTGSDLTYSHETMDLIIRPGKDGHPCTVNGTSYPGIHYNLTTGELKTSLTNMSILPLN